MQFILKLVVSTLAILVTSYFLPGVKVDNAWSALLLAAVLSFLNGIIKPAMVILTIPITIVSLGLFLVVINALIIMMADYIVDGFQVNGFWWALIFSIILSIVTSILERLNGSKQVEDEE